MAFIRLLQRMPDGEIVFREPSSSDIPAYGILSHTWGEEELSYQDLKKGKGKRGAGWKKIQFCAKQAAADGLEYFWIDTCCINKKNAVELSAAINSMFRWYQEAKRCYVYLLDVPIQGKGQSKPTWEPAFRNSRWFTRGWTLQELIAPKYVDFFSSEGEPLGDKMSLDVFIHDITGISSNALHNYSLSNFTINERMTWAESRNTTIEEDKAYCLLGIFDVSMPLIYGEGREKAVRRLQHEIDVSYKGTDFEQFSVGIDLLTLPRPAQFVSRSKELTEMHEQLHGHGSRSIVILYGLGGIGKTQLACAYAMRHEQKYTAIFWLNANDENSLRLSFRAIAQQVLKSHPSTSLLASMDLDDLNQVVDAVKAWLDLQKNTHWLVIYDNYDNPQTPGNADSLAISIRQFLPRSNQGSIVITTRSAQVSEGYRIHVQKLPEIQDGLEILSNTSGRKDIDTDPDAIALVKELDGLPLALSTAGAYLEQITTSFSDYVQFYKESWLKLQKTSPQLTSYEDRSLYTTWQITFDRIEQQNAASAKLLKLWAYFDRQDIWFGLLRHANSAEDEWIQKLTEDELSFNEAVRLLCNYGLVDIELSSQESGSNVYSMHSCVHSWTAFVLNQVWDKNLARLAFTCVAKEIPSTDAGEWWFLQRRLLQHAKRHQQFMTDGKIDVLRMEWELYQLGGLYFDQGKLADAEVIFRRTLQGYEEIFGPMDEMVSKTVNMLGLVYRYQGKLDGAEKMFTRALQVKEGILGVKHVSTLHTVNDLGIVYCDQGRLAEAEAMYIRALQGREESLGFKNRWTLDTVNNLGLIFAKQGKLSEAETMFRRALQGYAEVVSLKHPSTLSTTNNLGIIFSRQSKLDEAEKMFTQVLYGYEEVRGPKHTSTLAALHSLGILYKGQGRLAEAEAMHTRELQGRDEVLGRKDLETLITVNMLGLIYADQDKPVQAEAMYTRALEGCEQVLGLKHIWTLNTVENLGLLYVKEDKLAKAEAMYIRALQGYDEALGLDLVLMYKPALDSMINLAEIFSRTGQEDKTEEMYSRAFSGFEAVQNASSERRRQLSDRIELLESVRVEDRL